MYTKQPDGIKYPIQLRENTTDEAIFKQAFIGKEHDIPLPFPPRWILDLGAYTGIVASFYTNKYPEAHIVSVEPESQNYRLLDLNTKHYPNIHIIKGAVWSKDEPLAIVDKSLGECGYIVGAAKGKYEFKGYSIPTIMKHFKIPYIDLLKVDIEGSEKELFSKNTSWISLVNCVACETHERFKKGCDAAYKSLFSNKDFTFSKRGEFKIYTRRVSLK